MYPRTCFLVFTCFCLTAWAADCSLKLKRANLANDKACNNSLQLGDRLTVTVESGEIKVPSQDGSPPDYLQLDKHSDSTETLEFIAVRPTNGEVKLNLIATFPPNSARDQSAARQPQNPSTSSTGASTQAAPPAARETVSFMVSLTVAKPTLTVSRLDGPKSLDDKTVLAAGQACEFKLDSGLTGFTLTAARGGNPISAVDTKSPRTFKFPLGQVELTLEHNGIKFPFSVSTVQKIKSIDWKDKLPGHDREMRISKFDEIPIDRPAITATYFDDSTVELPDGDLRLKAEPDQPQPQQKPLVELESGRLVARRLPDDYPKDADVKISIAPDSVVSCAEPGAGTSQPDPLKLKVRLFKNMGEVAFDTPPALTPGGHIILRASQLMPDGSIRSGLPYSWKVGNNTDDGRKWDDKIKVTSAPNGTGVAIGYFSARDLDDPEKSYLTGPIPIKAVLKMPKMEGAPDVEGTVFITLGKVDGFKPLTVKISIMDDQTASDLFGKKTSQEYYVASVRMFNDLDKDTHGTPLGSSILAFSASIDVGITLQKRGIGGSKKDEWVPLSESDVLGLAGRFGYSTDDCKAVPPTTLETLNRSLANLKGDLAEAKLEEELAKDDLSKLRKLSETSRSTRKRAKEAETRQKEAVAAVARLTVEEVTLRKAIEDLKAAQENSKSNSKDAVSNPLADQSSNSARACPPTYLSYRPYTYDVMLNTVDSRDRRAPRSRFFQTAQWVGTLASFSNAVAIAPGKTKFSTYLDQYANMLIPGLQKVFPSLKETERQNVVNMTMKPIEEIPFGSDLEKKLFFPKKEINGMLAGYHVRIANIDPFRFVMRVAVLNKEGMSLVAGSSAVSGDISVSARSR